MESIGAEKNRRGYSFSTVTGILSTGLRKMIGFRETGLVFFIFLISIILANLSPVFLTKANIVSTILGLSLNGIVVIGMTVALISGGFDLSVGSVVALTGIVAGRLFLGGMDIWLAAFIAFMVAVSIGLINGSLITYLGLNSLITTLATAGLARGACYIITRGRTLALLSMPSEFKVLGKGIVFGIPYLVIILIVLVVISDILLRKAGLFRLVFYTGSNEKAAEMSGINTKKIRLFVYTFVSALAGIAGILSLARFTVGSPRFGEGMEMSVISAAVIGGASLAGGEGTIYGSILGLILLAIVSNALILLNISVYWQTFISSGILLLAVSFDIINEKFKAKRMTSREIQRKS